MILSATPNFATGSFAKRRFLSRARPFPATPAPQRLWGGISATTRPILSVRGNSRTTRSAKARFRPRAATSARAPLTAVESRREQSCSSARNRVLVDHLFSSWTLPRESRVSRARSSRLVVARRIAPWRSNFSESCPPGANRSSVRELAPHTPYGVKPVGKVGPVPRIAASPIFFSEVDASGENGPRQSALFEVGASGRNRPSANVLFLSRPPAAECGVRR